MLLESDASPLAKPDRSSETGQAQIIPGHVLSEHGPGYAGEFVS
jgi:hypothetical protein